MRLLDVVEREPRPSPWSEGDNIPWHDPDFSARMLQEHLSQAHDRASRRFQIVDRHVDWIHADLLQGRQARILDLGCGPGLYSSRLARRGHHCTGIDYSPASVAHAQANATRDRLTCSYHHADIRAAAYGTGFDLALLIYGEFNVFRPEDAHLILQKCRAALGSDGLLLLEPHTYAAVERSGLEAPVWYSSSGGLFSPAPHLVLMESAWDASRHTASKRYYVADAATAAVSRYAQTFQAYTESEYHTLLESEGFLDVRILPGLAPDRSELDPEFCAIVARRAPDR